MLILTILLTLLIAAFFAWLPGRLDHRKLNRTDLWSGPGLVLAVWVWAACIYSKPGLTAGFDAFRLLGIAGMALWICAVVCGFRLRHRLPRFCSAAAVGLLLASALGLELFVCNLNFWASHSYTPVDLRPYLTEDADAEAPLTLNDEHNTLTFAGLDQELYNLQLIGLTYQYDGPHPEVQSPLFTLTVAATDEASSVSRQSWPWQVAARSVRSQTRSLDLSGKASTLTLTAAAYDGEYRQYPLSYTLETVYANVPRPLDFSLVRFAALFALMGAAFALRPASVLWREVYLEHTRRYRPAVLLVMAVLAASAFLAPFADRFNAGVATSFYNTADWDGVSRITFTKHINDWANDTAAQYGALAHSLLNGRLDLEKDPPEGMLSLENPYDTAARQQAAPDALWDVAYYEGRYYVYFGLVPCLLFQLPFEALTGVGDLPPSLPMILLSWLFIWASFGCVKQALRRWFPRASAAVYLLTATGVAAGSQIWYLLLRPSVYEYAILCGAAFVMLGLWQWLAAANTPVEKRGRLLSHLALGSLCMALVAGCRPQMELFAVLALPIFWQRYVRQKRLVSRAGAGEAVAFLLPVIAVAAVLMWYNAARFGSPFDFGANYNLTSNDMTRRGFGVGRIAPAVLTFLFGVPGVSTVFPYLSATRMSTNYMGLTITELFYGGAFVCLPLLWGLAVLPLARRRLDKQRDLRAWLLLTLAAMLVLAILDCEMAGMLYRYQSDWLGPLLLAGALAWLLAEQVLQDHTGQPGVAALQSLYRTALPLAVLAGAVYNFCVYFSAEPGLIGQNPALYQNASRLVQFWL
ncbi:MAG: hypothetical protein ACI4KC_05010 [Gemmiger sp.]